MQAKKLAVIHSENVDVSATLKPQTIRAEKKATM